MGQGMGRDVALGICSVSRHQFYHRKVSNKRAGRPASTHTPHVDGFVDNARVVSAIKAEQADPDTDYGYRKMRYRLLQLGYTINHKKTYRLMKQAGLLKDKIKPAGGKAYARYRAVVPERPLQVLEMDIKTVWLAQYRRHAYILNIIDTFTRRALYWSAGYQMRQEQVKHAWRQVIEQHLQPADLLSKRLHVELRNDNGPQFGAAAVREMLAQNHIRQVFTHPYTPQENGHVESFHNTLKKALGEKPYWSLHELEERLQTFYHAYNYRRIHASTAYLAPCLFEKCWHEGLVDRKVFGKTKASFKLNVPYQNLSGFESLREVFCVGFEALDGPKNQTNDTDEQAA